MADNAKVPIETFPEFSGGILLIYEIVLDAASAMYALSFSVPTEKRRRRHGDACLDVAVGRLADPDKR